jgi:L-ascorbate metabolism protein UlaG (beta-lactamase superfamily)
MRYSRSDHFDGKRFHNLEIKKGPGLLEVLKWKISGKMKKWPKKVENQIEPQLPLLIENDQVFVTHINHSTMLVQVHGLNIITDPVFSQRVSPFSWAGPKRARDPGIQLHNLPKIDAVLLSHSHYDHLDLASIRQIDKRDQPIHVVPLGVGSILQRAGIKRTVELDWWEEHRFNDDHVFVLTPAHHWSQRHFFDYCKTLWGGFVIRSKNLKVFFAGDSGYSSHFQKIFNRFGKMDVSILPIGAYEPRWFMKEHHMDPHEAVVVHKELGSDLSIGMHFGTFQLTDEAIDDPVVHLKESLVLHQLPQDVFIAPENGQTISFSRRPLLLQEEVY